MKAKITTYLPEQRPTTRIMSQPVLRSGVFGIRNKASPRRAKQVSIFPVFPRGTLTYDGPELRQDDESVLLELIAINGGDKTTRTIQFNPWHFVVTLNWSRTKSSVERLKACLLRMVGPTLIFAKEDGEEVWKSALIGSVFGLDSKEWSVSLAACLGHMFYANPTYLRSKVRSALSEGLQTWLYGYLRTHNGRVAINLEDLREMSGSQASPKLFQRDVRSALAKIEAAGGIIAPVLEHGRLRWERCI